MIFTVCHQPLTPGAVLHGSRWHEISRDEALMARDDRQVVIVFRNGGTAVADWFTTGHPLRHGAAAQSIFGARYFRLRGAPPRLIVRGSSLPAMVVDRTPTPPSKASTPSEVRPKTWVEIALVDDEGKPMPGEAYQIELPDGSIRTGVLDGSGRARVDGIDPGSCQISFTSIDGHEWRAAG